MTTTRLSIAVGVIFLLGGCQSDSTVQELLKGREIQYEDAELQKRNVLKYPPDLIAEKISIEDDVSLSEYRIDKVPDIQEIVPDKTGSKVIYRRSGNLRWVSVELPPNEAWPLVRSFWTDYLSFPLVKEDLRSGVMETDWLKLREGLSKPGPLGDLFDEFFDQLRDSGERDKFLTRVETSEEGGTDVFISHRHIIAQFDNDGRFTGYEPKKSETQLEVEMMRRLMLLFADKEEDDLEEGFTEEIQSVENEANNDYTLREESILIKKPLRDSWLLVRIALDRGGFSVEDRDFIEGVFYIQHSGGPESNKIFGENKGGILDKLFGDKPVVLRNLKLGVHEYSENAEQTIITVADADGKEALTPEQTAIILQLLIENLP